MSSIPPPPGPDDRTRPMGAPVPPAAPVPPPAPGYERERVVEQVVEPEFDPRFALASIEDSLRSLKTAVLLLGVLSVLALALGGYALIRAIDADQNERVVRGGGSSDNRETAALEERLDELEESIERDSGDAPDASDVRGLREDLEGKADASEVAELEQAVSGLSDRVEQSGDGNAAETAQALEDLSQRVDEIDQRLQQQEQQQP